jgi:hypothetical protein
VPFRDAVKADIVTDTIEIIDGNDKVPYNLPSPVPATPGMQGGCGLGRVILLLWGQVERGEKPVTNRRTLEAMADALRVHPTELTGQPGTPLDAADADAQAGLLAIDTALERYELGVDPEQNAYVRLPQRRQEVLLGLIQVHRVVMQITKDLGDRGLPMVAVRAVRVRRGTGGPRVAGVCRSHTGIRHG